MFNINQFLVSRPILVAGPGNRERELVLHSFIIPPDCFVLCQAALRFNKSQQLDLMMT